MASVSYRTLQIIGALASSDKPLEKAERCLEIHNQPSRKKVRSDVKGHHHKSQYWITDLIQVLCAEEPKIEEDELTFVPKILLLPVDVQRNTLAFLIHHAKDIPTINLVNLLSPLQIFLSQQLDEWCRFHILTLQNILHQRTKQFCTKQHKKQDVSSRQKISKQSLESFDNICKQLTDASSCSTSNSAAMNRCKLKFDCLSEMIPTDSEPNLTNQSNLQKSNVTSLSDNDNESYQQNQETKNKIRPSRQEEVVMKIPRLEGSEAGDDNPQDGFNLEDLFPVDNPPFTEEIGQIDQISSELVGQEDTNSIAQLAIPGLQDTISEDKPRTRTDGIDESLKNNLDLLKNELLTCSADSVLSETAQDTLKRILHSSVEVSEDLWDVVALDNVPLVGLECLFQYVVQRIGPAELSYTAAYTMARRCFFNKLCESSNTVPRALGATLFAFAKAFPKPTIEGVILPSIIRQDVTIVQCDMIAKLTKDVLTNEYRIYLLNGLFQSKEIKWGEHHTSLVQNILNNKIELDQKSLSSLVTSLEHHGTVHHSCKKLAKLLLFVINQYGKQMTGTDISSMQRLVAANQTFLKKAALNALKKFHK